MSLNKTQAKAVSHKDGPCLVLAGPGSGKTLTIVNRIKYLIEKCSVRPEEILVVTFTRFAAQEMKNRLCSLMGKKNLPVTAGTFHGIFYGILRCTYRMNGQNILSEEEKYQLLREVISRQEAEVFDEEDFISDIAAEIGKIKITVWMWRSMFRKNAVRKHSGKSTANMRRRESGEGRLILTICLFSVTIFCLHGLRCWKDGRESSAIF